MPIQYGTYRRKATGIEYRFIGYAESLTGAGINPEDVCLMAPSVSGFDLASSELKKSEEHTIYVAVTPETFDTHFELVSPPSERNTEGV